MGAFQVINRRIRVLIADDHAVIRKMVRLTLQRFPQFEVCGEAEDGIQAVAQAKKIPMWVFRGGPSSGNGSKEPELPTICPLLLMLHAGSKMEDHS